MPKQNVLKANHVVLLSEYFYTEMCRVSFQVYGYLIIHTFTSNILRTDFSLWLAHELRCSTDRMNFT